MNGFSHCHPMRGNRGRRCWGNNRGPGGKSKTPSQPREFLPAKDERSEQNPREKHNAQNNSNDYKKNLLIEIIHTVTPFALYIFSICYFHTKVNGGEGDYGGARNLADTAKKHRMISQFDDIDRQCPDF